MNWAFAVRQNDRDDGRSIEVRRNVKPLVFGSRGSALALAQTRLVIAQLQAAWPSRTFDLRVIKTQGDRLSEDVGRPMDEALGKGLFTGELERALRNGEIDLAVHSLKDLPTGDAEGLVLRGDSGGADARDVLVTRYASTLEDRPADGSTRRRHRQSLGVPRRFEPCARTCAPYRFAATSTRGFENSASKTNGPAWSLPPPAWND